MLLSAYLAHLRALAAKATPGKWRCVYDFNVENDQRRGIANCGGYQTNMVDPVHLNDENRANAKWIVAVSPEIVLALVEVAEAASRQSLAQIDYTPEHCDLFDALAALTAVAAQQTGGGR